MSIKEIILKTELQYYAAQKRNFSLAISSVNVTKSAFTEEILNEKLHFCALKISLFGQHCVAYLSIIYIYIYTYIYTYMYVYVYIYIIFYYKYIVL